MKKIAVILVALFIITSCQEVIEVDLNEADPRYVIEGSVVLGTNDFRVSLTQTTSYFTSETPARIAGASMVLSDDEGNSHTLTDSGNGAYFLPSFTATSGTEYTLAVTVEDKSFTASAVMPSAIEIDTAFIEERDRISISFEDPAATVDFYRLQMFVNGLRENIGFNGSASLVIDDTFQNGEIIERSVGGSGGVPGGGGPGGSDDPSFITGDVVLIRLSEIDTKTYDFFRSLEDVSGGTGPGAAAPGNPVNNWSNGALGYFGTEAIDEVTIVVP